MRELGEFAPSGASPARLFVVAAGFAAAGVLGLLGLYQGFGLTWRPYPQIERAPPSDPVSPDAMAVAPVAVDSEAALVERRSSPSPNENPSPNPPSTSQ